VAPVRSALYILLETLLCEGKPKHLHDDRSRAGGLGNEHRLLDHASCGHALEVFLEQGKKLHNAELYNVYLWPYKRNTECSQSLALLFRV
jgi:hypothetical protein